MEILHSEVLSVLDPFILINELVYQQLNLKLTTFWMILSKYFFDFLIYKELKLTYILSLTIKF